MWSSPAQKVRQPYFAIFLSVYDTKVVLQTHLNCKTFFPPNQVEKKKKAFVIYTWGFLKVNKIQCKSIEYVPSVVHTPLYCLPRALLMYSMVHTYIIIDTCIHKMAEKHFMIFMAQSLIHISINEVAPIQFTTMIGNLMFPVYLCLFFYPPRIIF